MDRYRIHRAAGKWQFTEIATGNCRLWSFSKARLLADVEQFLAFRTATVQICDGNGNPVYLMTFSKWEGPTTEIIRHPITRSEQSLSH